MPTGAPDRAGLQLTRRERRSSFVNYPTKTAGAIPRSTGHAIKRRDAITCANGGISRGGGAKKREKIMLQDFPYRSPILR